MTTSIWPGDSGQVAVLQDRYSVTVRFELLELNEPLGAFLFGPLWLLAFQFSRLTPFWYLRGDDD